MTLDAPPAFDSEEWLSQQENDAAKELAASNVFCRMLLLATLAAGALFILAVAYVAMVHT